MASEIRIPHLGVNDTQALLVEWHVSDGSRVEAGQDLCTLETSKMTQPLTADKAGFVFHHAQAGTEQQTDALIGWVSEVAERPVVAAKTPVKDTAEGPQITKKAMDLLVSLGLNAKDLPSKTGVWRENDIRDFAAQRGSSSTPNDSTDLPQGVPSSSIAEQHALPRAQRQIREAMSHSLTTNAHAYLSMDVDISALTETLAKLTQQHEQAIRLNDAVIAAVATGLRKFPAFNSFFWKDQRVTYKDVTVGMAVDLDGILLVPVIREADRKTLPQIAQESSLLQMKIMRKTLSPAECEGGTFTLTNLGGLGVHAFVPIINGHQSAILAIGAPQKRVVLINKQAEERLFVTLGLSYDHRLHNGMGAARFLKAVTDQLGSLVSQGELQRG